MAESSDLITISEAASLIGLDRSSLYYYLNREDSTLPTVKFGKRTFFIRSGLAEWNKARLSALGRRRKRAGGEA